MVEISEASVRRYISGKFNWGKQEYTMVANPGEEAQVDFGYVGLMRDKNSGKMRKTYALIMTLSYSRYRFVQFTFKQDVKTWVECHIKAFRFFGGVPQRVLLDNLKAGVIKADIYDPTINRTYAELERFYGFVADPAKVRTPEHKGKVERSVTIVKQQLIAGRRYHDLEDASTKALDWCRNVNAKAITRTTGQTPEMLFEEEKQLLQKSPRGDFDISEWSSAIVQKDHHIVFRGSFYSIPTDYINKEVWIRAGLRTVDVYHDEKLIKSHIKLLKKGKWQTDHNDYPSAALRYLNKTPEKCIEEAKHIGEATKELISDILQKPSKQKLRKVQAILRLQENFGKERLEKACFKSFVYGNYSYDSIKTILEKGIEEKVQEEPPAIFNSINSENLYLRAKEEYKNSMEDYYGQ